MQSDVDGNLPLSSLTVIEPQAIGLYFKKWDMYCVCECADHVSIMGGCVESAKRFLIPQHSWWSVCKVQMHVKKSKCFTNGKMRILSLAFCHSFDLFITT